MESDKDGLAERQEVEHKNIRAGVRGPLWLAGDWTSGGLKSDFSSGGIHWQG